MKQKKHHNKKKTMIVLAAVAIEVVAGCKKKETVKLYTDEAIQITSNLRTNC